MDAFDSEITLVAEGAGEPRAHVDHDLMAAEVRISCMLAMLLCLDRDTRMAHIPGELAELDHEAAAEILVLECPDSVDSL